MSIKHALVVDDSKSARFSLKKLLQQQDIKTDFAESAGDALNYLSSHTPDIIFMDHLMPGMDGFEATKAIKENPDTRDIPVIMCTSKEGSDYAQQALALGAYAILPKPAPAATLTAILNRLDPGVAKEDNKPAESGSAPSQSVGISNRAVESLVRKVMDEKMDSLQKAITETLRTTIISEMKEELDRAKADLRTEFGNRLDNQIREKGTSIAQRVAAELLESRLEEMSTSVNNMITTSKETIATTLEAARKPSPDLIEEVKKVAQFTSAAAAGETAKQAAMDVSRSVAEDIARQELEAVREGLGSQLNQSVSATVKQNRMLALVGIVCGIAAITISLAM